MHPANVAMAYCFQSQDNMEISKSVAKKNVAPRFECLN